MIFCEFSGSFFGIGLDLAGFKGIWDLRNFVTIVYCSGIYRSIIYVFLGEFSGIQR